MDNTLFNPDIDQALYEKELKRPAADNTYLAFFTARSGSSWLTDICKRSGRLSFPDEGLNPAFIPIMSGALNARNMTEYLNVLRRRRNTHGVYGVQITYHHLRAIFDDEDEFMSYLGNWKMIWLLREDIVLQAISLMKMQQTQITHQAASDPEQRAAAEKLFVYEPRQIKRWIKHNFVAERMSEALFARYSLSPLRLSYEGITAAGAHNTVNALAHYLEEPAIIDTELESKHGKLGTTKNAEFAARFRKEHEGYLAKLAAKRAPWLARIEHTPATGL